MGDKPRVIPNQTYVLDEKDVEGLEELTIATVMQEALDPEDQEPKEGDATQPSPQGDDESGVVSRED
jgi:hypothetical protein